MRELRVDERVLLMREPYATPELGWQDAARAAPLADLEDAHVARCNQCGRPSDGHAHAERDE